MPVRVMTWNLQGREHPDLDAVVAHVRAVAPDVVVLQEVQRRQARRLAGALGWQVTWRFKHWPLVIPAEGLAIVTPAEVPDAVTVHLAHRWRFWSSDRRIAIAATAAGMRVVNAHLGAGVTDGERLRQARLVADAVLDPQGVVAGDLNAPPGSTVISALASAGYRDAWGEARPGEPGATNWRAGPRTEPPTQRLDYVLVGEELTVVDVSLPSDPVPFGRLSDHLPLTVSVGRERPAPGGHRLARRRRR